MFEFTKWELMEPSKGKLSKDEHECFAIVRGFALNECDQDNPKTPTSAGEQVDTVLR